VAVVVRPERHAEQGRVERQKADYVAFSLEPDLTKLVPKFVNADWNSARRRAWCPTRSW